MAIIDTYNKSGISAKIDNNGKTAGFKTKEQQGDPSEFNLTPEFLDKKDLNGSGIQKKLLLFVVSNVVAIILLQFLIILIVIFCNSIYLR
jgi:hypothetical protein